MEAFERVCRVQLGAMRGREGHIGQDVVLGLVHDGGELRRLGPELVATWRHWAEALSASSWAKELGPEGLGLGRADRHAEHLAAALVLASWRALLNRMLSFAMSSGDSIEADIRQLHALCEQQDQEAFLPLKPHELALEIPRRMLQFNRLVDDAVELARERDIVNTDSLKVTPRPHGYGRYLRLGSTEADVWAGAWFGVNHTLWARSRETPLWITFYYWDGVITVDELRDRLGNDIWANTPDSIPFHLPTGVEYDKVLADVVERLVSIATQIAAEEAP